MKSPKMEIEHRLSGLWRLCEALVSQCCAIICIVQLIYRADSTLGASLAALSCKHFRDFSVGGVGFFNVTV